MQTAYQPGRRVIALLASASLTAAALSAPNPAIATPPNSLDTTTLGQHLTASTAALDDQLNTRSPEPETVSIARHHQPRSPSGLKPFTRRVNWWGEAGAGAGSALASGDCDVNGDSFADAIVGSWFWNKAPNARVGAAYVVFGAHHPTGGDLTNPAAASAVRINGPDERSALVGFSVGCLGDVNGDGFDDVAIGDFIKDQIYVVYGSKHFSEVNLGHLGDRGYLLKGPNPNSRFGFAVTGVGDLDGDGLADLAVADLAADTLGRKNNGAIYVVRGQGGTGTRQVTNPLAVIHGAANQNRLSTVAPTGDVNGDGHPDLLVGAYVADPHGVRRAANGAAYVVFGQPGGAIGQVDTANLGAAGFAIHGPKRGRDRLGIAVAAAGDINGDGLADVVIGADGVSNPKTGVRNGGAAVVYGSANTETVLISPDADQPVTAGNINRGWWIEGAAANDGAGFSVAGVGDTNNDGVPDLVIGAEGADPVGADGKPMNLAGSAYLVFGQKDQTKVELANLSATQGRVFHGTAPGQRFGRRAASLGDVDRNGRADFMIGGDAPGFRVGPNVGIAAIQFVGPAHPYGPSSGIRPEKPFGLTTPNGLRKHAKPSMAFTMLNWRPTPQDTCPQWLHEKYSMVAHDGRQYPTWHPPVVVHPHTGKQCTFGHEHGDNPRTSDIYHWVSEFLSDQHQQSPGIPFGLAAQASMAGGGGHKMRSEDHGGHKIYVANDVTLLTEKTREPVLVAGKPVQCDYLMKLHQGSHSADAHKNNAHELLYAVKCTDGTELISTTLALFGNPNEFHQSCDGAVQKTSGAHTPAGFGGRRLIPTEACVRQHLLVPENRQSDRWGLYELWQSANQLTQADGTVLATFDPWFGVRNPSRFASTQDPNRAVPTLTAKTLTAENANQVRGFPWHQLPQEAKPQDWVGSPFNGGQRDFYLSGPVVKNVAETTWYTDPFGRNAQPKPFTGAVRQHIVPGGTVHPPTHRYNLGLNNDYGPPASGVHSPN